MTTALSPERMRLRAMILTMSTREVSIDEAWSGPGAWRPGYGNRSNRRSLSEYNPVDHHGCEDQREIPEGIEESFAGQALAGMKVEAGRPHQEETAEDDGADKVDFAEPEGNRHERDGGEDSCVEQHLLPRFRFAHNI